MDIPANQMQCLGTVRFQCVITISWQRGEKTMLEPPKTKKWLSGHRPL